MKIILNQEEAVKHLEDHFRNIGTSAKVEISEASGGSKREKIIQLNNYWCNCISPTRIPILNREGFEIMPTAHMNIPLIKLYRSMYFFATGESCPLADAKRFVETHQ